MKTKHKSQGFSLVEALVVLALLAVLLGLAVPGVASLRVRHELQAVAEDVWNSLMLARSQALVQQARVVVCPAASMQTCDEQGHWAAGWHVFVDSNRNGQRDAGEQVLQSRGALPVGVRLLGNSSVSLGMGYGADGRSEGRSGGFQSGTYTLCKPGLPEQWSVVINMLGRPRMAKTEAEDCP
jgi:type IV fimbrial biogenesis protein FimT